eukprot:9100399-Pyramimonas_sp.AAC.2
MARMDATTHLHHLDVTGGGRKVQCSGARTVARVPICCGLVHIHLRARGNPLGFKTDIKPLYGHSTTGEFNGNSILPPNICGRRKNAIVES